MANHDGSYADATFPVPQQGYLLNAWQQSMWEEYERGRLENGLYAEKQAIKGYQYIQDQTTLEQKKADLRIARELKKSEISFNASGVLERKQQYFCRAAERYEVANFCLLESPVLCVPTTGKGKVLRVKIRINDMEEKTLFLNLEKNGGSYFRKIFRNAGVLFKLTKWENENFFEDLIGRLLKMSNLAIVPTARGFYRVENVLCYADGNAVLWKEMLENAKS